MISAYIDIHDILNGEILLRVEIGIDKMRWSSNTAALLYFYFFILRSRNCNVYDILGVTCQSAYDICHADRR